MANKNMNEFDELDAFSSLVRLWATKDPGGTPELVWLTAEMLLRGYSDFKVYKNQSSDPSVPSSGYTLTFTGPDGTLYTLDSSGNKTAVGEGVLGHVVNARISPTSGVAFEEDADSAVEEVFWTPCDGKSVRLYSDSTWKNYNLTEDSFKLTDDSQTCTTINGIAVITDLTDTSKLIVGMEVTGVGIPASTTIASIDSATQVTLSATATADGSTIAVTFKVPANTKMDLFGTADFGNAALRRPIFWTDLTTRATALTLQDGVDVLTGEATAMYLGWIKTGDTAGQLDYNLDVLNIVNKYNNLPTEIQSHDYRLYQAFTGSRYMPQTMKDAATWTTTSDTGSVVSSANMYNGDLSTYGYCVYQADYLNIKIDWGSATKLNQIDINFGTNPDVRFDQVWIYGSATGAFAGEETTIINGESGGAAFENWQIDFTAAEYRYWKIRLYGVEAATSGLIYDINFKYFIDPPAISGGYMSTAEKQAASWTDVSNNTVTNFSNMYDGNAATFAVIDRYYIIASEIDFGKDVILDKIEYVVETGVWTTATVKISDTGAFAGEETTLSISTAESSGIRTVTFLAGAVQSRYWRISLYRNYYATDNGIYEINFHFGSSFIVQGVPLGCEVQLWNGNGLIEAQVSDNYAFNVGLVEFTTANIADVDTVKITKPDGSDWLEFTGLSFSTGDLYSLTKGQ